MRDDVVDAMVGPTLEVFLHAVGHAVWDYLGGPIFGRMARYLTGHAAT